MNRVLRCISILILACVIFIGCGSSRKEEELKPITWPTNEAGGLIPKPEVMTGEIIWENSDGFDINIKPFTSDQFVSYVQQCQEAGVTEDYNKTDSVILCQ